MKQFKKWEGTHSPGEYAYQKWEEGWRAALELVLGWLDYSAEHKEIADKIHEELGDT